MVKFSSCLICQIISFILPPNEYGCVYASLSGAAIDLQKVPILAKKIVFSDEAHFDLGRYVNKRNCRIWGTENQHAFIEKPTHTKRVTVWCGFWSRGIIGIMNEFLFTKIEEATFGFNRTALRAIQPKLHSMFCALFLKIALSAADLMSFGHLVAAI